MCSQVEVLFSVRFLLHKVRHEKIEKVVAVYLFQIPAFVVGIILLYEHIPHSQLDKLVFRHFASHLHNVSSRQMFCCIKKQ